MKKIVIAGGSGFIGTYLKKRFAEYDYSVQIVSRQAGDVSWNLDDLIAVLNEAEIVVNLAGKSINCRHNKANRTAILDSRIKSTQLIGIALEQCRNPPKLWINASAVGVYMTSVEKAATEFDTDLGDGFLADVVRRWEETMFGFRLKATRRIALRTSVVLGKGGGALQSLILLSRLGLGGKQGSGRQIFSWIHWEDYFQIILFLLNQSQLEGVFNCTSPQPLPNDQLMRSIRRTLGMPIGIPAPEFAIRLGAKIIGAEPELILNSSHVLPKRLVDLNYQFKFDNIDKALINLLHKPDLII